MNIINSLDRLCFSGSKYVLIHAGSLMEYPLIYHVYMFIKTKKISLRTAESIIKVHAWS